MKTKQLHIQPRQSGKTTKIIKMFICDWERDKDVAEKKWWLDQRAQLAGAIDNAKKR